MPKWAFAVAYDLLNSGVEGRLAARRRRTAGQATGKVLEIGVGTGANLPFYGPEVRLTVVEPNPHMAGRMARKATGMGRQVETVPGVGERLSFPAASFDSAVTTLVLCSVGDPRAVLSETRRVLRPGGAPHFYEHVAAAGPWKRRLQDGLAAPWRMLADGCNLNGKSRR